MEADVRSLVRQALEAIEDDSPDFGAPLVALARAPAALATLASDPSLHEALMPALRKLRPVTLWVRDEAPAALTAKRVAFLDGALCRLAPEAATPPPPEGRECWVEVAADGAQARIRALGPGWGLLVAGDLHRTSFETLRRSAPLCALGAVIAAPLSLVPRVPLDLVVLEGTSVGSEVPGARVLRAGVPTDELGRWAVPDQIGGVVCRAADALGWALRLAAQRAARG